MPETGGGLQKPNVSKNTGGKSFDRRPGAPEKNDQTTRRLKPNQMGAMGGKKWAAPGRAQSPVPGQGVGGDTSSGRQREGLCALWGKGLKKGSCRAAGRRREGGERK